MLVGGGDPDKSEDCGGDGWVMGWSAHQERRAARSSGQLGFAVAAEVGGESRGSGAPMAIQRVKFAMIESSSLGAF